MAKRSIYLSVLTVFVLLGSAPPMGADERDEPVDLIIALDKSKSMVQEIDAVKEYVKTHVVDQIIQEGDRLIVVAFYGQNEIAVSAQVGALAEKEAIKRAIEELQADGAFTDIGFALDRLQDEVMTKTQPERKKTLLLITDGIDEPPPGSKYASPDGWRSHEYMEVTSETQKHGWKIIVLGVGAESAAAIAQDLSGQYVETEEEPTVEEIAEAVPDLVGTISVVGSQVSAMNQAGRFRLTLQLETSGYREGPQVTVTEVAFEGRGDAGAVDLSGLLREPVTADLPADGTSEMQLTLRAPQPPAPGEYRGSLELVFASKEQFDRFVGAELRVNSFLQNFPWLLPVAVVLLAAIVTGIVLATAARNRVKIRLVVEEKPLPAGRDEFNVRKGHDAFLRESLERFDISETRTPKTIARLSLKDRAVALEPVKEERFPELSESQSNILGARLLVRSESGTDFHLRFESGS